MTPALLSALFSKRRIQTTIQSESSECGLACIAMILHYFGDNRGIHRLRREYAPSIQGMTLAELLAVGRQVNLSCRPVKLTLDGLSELSTPAILHWDLNHFVVLEKVSNNSVVLHDPAVGRKRLSIIECSAHFTGVAIEVTKAHSFTQHQFTPLLTLGDFWRKTSGLKRALTVLMGLSLSTQLLGVLAPLQTQLIIDHVISPRMEDNLAIIVLGFSLVLASELLLDGLRQFVHQSTSTQLQYQLGGAVIGHLLKLPAHFVIKRQLGDLMSRVSSIEQVNQFLTTALVTLFVDGCLALLTLIMMLLLSWQLSVVVLISATIYAVLQLISSLYLAREHQQQIAVQAEHESYQLETLRHLLTLQLNHMTGSRLAGWNNKWVNCLNKGVNISRVEIKLGLANKAIFGIEQLAILWIAALMVLDQAITVGILFAFISYKSRFIGSTDALIGLVVQHRLLRVHLERLSDILATQPAENTAESCNHSGRTKPSTGIDLCLLDWCVRHHSSQPSLVTVKQLRLKAATSIAIIGSSGSGKSSFLNSLIGTLEHQEGRVEYQGGSYLHLGQLPVRVSTVLQQDALLRGSILDNICCFGEVDYRRVEQVCRLCLLDTEIARLPAHLHTPIGDLGDGLSGGQKQRILLARAIYRKPHVLLMDEATSALDEQTEARLVANLKQLPMIQLFIAHRRQTFMAADQILLLKDQQLVDVTTQIKCSPKALRANSHPKNSNPKEEKS